MLASLAYFGISALSYFASIQTARFLNGNPLVEFVEAVAFTCGLFSLAFGSLALQYSGWSTGKRKVRVPRIRESFFFAMIAILSTYTVIDSPITLVGGSVSANEVVNGMFLVTYIGLPLVLYGVWKGNRKLLWIGAGVMLFPYILTGFL